MLDLTLNMMRKLFLNIFYIKLRKSIFSLHELDRRGVGSSGGSLRHRNIRKSLHGGESLNRGSPFELEEFFLNRNSSLRERQHNANTTNFRARSRSAGRQSSGRQSAKLVGVVPSFNTTPLFLQK